MFSNFGHQVQYRSLGFFADTISENTLELMASSIRQSGKNPNIIRMAQSIVEGTPQKDEWAEAEAIYHFVQNHSRYIKDPHGTEMLQSPLVALDFWKRGMIWQGDCDDFTIVILSLLKSIGYPVAIRAASYNPKKTLQHVYGLVKLYNQWFPVDGIKEGGFIGWEKEPYTRIYDYTVDK